VLDLLRRFSADPKKAICFNNIELKHPMAVPFATSFEGDISSITLDNCSP
jgi:hypothetical protein